MSSKSCSFGSTSPCPPRRSPGGWRRSSDASACRRKSRSSGATPERPNRNVSAASCERLDELEPDLSAGCQAQVSPARGLIEALGPGARARGEPQPLETLRPEPAYHLVMEPFAITLPLMVRVDEERPNVACRGVSNGEGQNCTLNLDDPPTAGRFNFAQIIRFGDDGRDEPVLAHGEPNAVHAGDIVAMRLSEDRVH